MEFGTNKILITGSNGWLGKSLIHCLINGIDHSPDIDKPNEHLNIKCFVFCKESSNPVEMQSENISIFSGDINNIDDCNTFTKDSAGAILFHCVGVIHPRKVSEFYKINVEGTKNILEAAIRNKIKKVIVVSSNSPCGLNPNNNHLFDEKYDYNPYMEYGRSKMIMEKLVINYFNKGLIETVIIRPPWFYGPYQPPRQTKFFRMIRDGKAPIIGDGKNKRSMACTINIAQGMIRSAMKEKANGNIYWIADKEPYTFNQIIETIRKVLVNEYNIKCKDNQIKLPNIVSSIAYYMDYLIQNMGLYNKEIHVLSEMNKTIACSIKKAEDDLNYRPTIDLYQGTKMSIESIISEF